MPTTSTGSALGGQHPIINKTHRRLTSREAVDPTMYCRERGTPLLGLSRENACTEHQQKGVSACQCAAQGNDDVKYNNY